MTHFKQNKKNLQVKQNMHNSNPIYAVYWDFRATLEEFIQQKLLTKHQWGEMESPGTNKEAIKN